jgi:hypothetical protein
MIPRLASGTGRGGRVSGVHVKKLAVEGRGDRVRVVVVNWFRLLV